jgi:hypothetical protein
VHYLLLLQAPDPRADFAVDAAEAALQARGATRAVDNSMTLSTSSGPVRFERLNEQQRCIALEVRVLLSDHTAGLTDALQLAGEVASASGCLLVDPQLQRSVGQGDLAAAQTKFSELAAYAGHYTGWSASAGMTSPSASSGPTSDPLVRIALVVFVIALVVGYWVVSSMLRQ